MVGIPNGLVLPLSFGISTRRTLWGTYQLNFRCTSTTSFSSFILLDVPVCQFDIFRQGDNFHQLGEHLAIHTFGIQLILNFLEIVIFSMAQFRFLQSLFLCCHSRSSLTFVGLTFLSPTRTYACLLIMIFSIYSWLQPVPPPLTFFTASKFNHRWLNTVPWLHLPPGLRKVILHLHSWRHRFPFHAS